MFNSRSSTGYTSRSLTCSPLKNDWKITFLSRWCFHIFFMFTPYLGKMNSFWLYNMFQMGLVQPPTSFLGWFFFQGRTVKLQLSREQNPPTFHFTGWLTGILIVVYFNPCIIGWYFILFKTQPNRGPLLCGSTSDRRIFFLPTKNIRQVSWTMPLL